LGGSYRQRNFVSRLDGCARRKTYCEIVSALSKNCHVRHSVCVASGEQTGPDNGKISVYQGEFHMAMTIKNAVAAVVLASMSMGVAVAADIDLYGGGATFPAVAYVGDAFRATNDRLSTVLGNAKNAAGDPGAAIGASVFDSFLANTVAPLKVGLSYCQTGSGGGKTNMVGGPALPEGNADVFCGDFASAAAGFSSVNNRPNYIGTDSPISTADYTNFQANVASKGALVQIPSLVGAVAIPFANADVSGTLDLSIDSVCRIFAREYTDWSQIPGANLPSKPITIVYRSDNSGTSFAFTNFLARNCNAANGGPIADPSPGVAYFQTNQSYATAAGNKYPAGTFKAASGNANVVNTVNANDGHIGYGDPGDVQSGGGSFALVNSLSPMSFSSPAFAAADLLTDTLVSSSASATTGLPATSAAPVSDPAFSGALTVINPAAVASSGYPIFATTYLVFFAAGNDTADVGGNPDAALALQDLVNFMYDYPSIFVGPFPWSPGRPALPVGYSYVNDANIGAGIQTAISLIAN
jgi:phosphate transport system substrate-binding protein